MNKLYMTGAIFLGLSVYCLLGAFGTGGDSLAIVLTEVGVPNEFSGNASRMLSGALLSLAIVLLILGFGQEADGRVVSHEEYLAVKERVEREDA